MPIRYPLANIYHHEVPLNVNALDACEILKIVFVSTWNGAMICPYLWIGEGCSSKGSIGGLCRDGEPSLPVKV